VQKLFDVYTALLSVNIAAISPPLVGRTLAGFADKDGLALLFGLISFYFYLNTLQEKRISKRIVFALAFGFSSTLLGLTWQGVGVFLGVTVITELIMLLLDEYDVWDFIVALCRYVPVLVGLTFSKAVYHNLSQPFVMLALLLPGSLLLLSLLYTVLNRFRIISQAFSLNNRVPIGFSLSMVVLVLMGLFSWDKIPIFWNNFLSPFGSNRLAQSIQELQKQGALGWTFWPGSFFLIICAGALFVYKDIVSRLRINVTVGLTLLEVFLIGLAFSRILSGMQIGNETSLTISIYIGTLIAFSVGTLTLYLTSIRQGLFGLY
ncbi:TPA: hypothetical protein EYP66_13055, partial [Candidatus Poribacteria bacterium]|nr:hypothetical protein [Candidatus Poribacteria bacterium]